jgi:hypothetical protein
MHKATKPKGWKAFDEIVRKLVQVPKTEVGKRRKQKRKKK